MPRGRAVLHPFEPEAAMSPLQAARQRLSRCREVEALAHAETLMAEGALDALRDAAGLSRLLTIEDVAGLLQVHVETVRKMKTSGRLPCVHVGESSPRFLETDVRTFIEEAKP